MCFPQRGSTPAKDSLVGLQKLAAANSNTATRHILQGSLYLTLKTCENISLRAADALMFPLTKMSLQNSISNYNMETLQELSKLSIHDFGIFIDLEPDEEEKQMLEQNIQVALQQGGIDLEDAIDIRNINNLIWWVLGSLKQSCDIIIVCSQMKIRMDYFQIQSHKVFQNFGIQ